jgi:hypothetical protein
MKSKILMLFAACTLVIAVTGCYSSADGRLKAGVPFVKDSLSSLYERPAAQVWTAAREVLTRNGRLVGDNTVAKTLTAKVDNRTVWVMIEDVDPRLTRVTVQARTSMGGADIALASEIDKQIVLQLR